MQKIQLIEPRDGGVTQPLQRYYWPMDDAEAAGAPRGAGASRDTIRWDDLGVSAEDRTQPAGVLFSWEFAAPGARPLRYDLHISRRPDFHETLVLKDLAETRAEVLHLHIATRYYWKVTAQSEGAVLSESAVGSFLTHDATPRWIGVPGMTNVRDLGGWPLPGGRRVRQGALYRSSEMNSHVIITEEGKRILVDSLGIRTDLDLRGQTEEAMPVLDPRRVQWINIPVYPYEAIGHPLFMPAYRRIFGIFADLQRYPILFHCWGGADRAGTVAFLISALLGKSFEHLSRDYELTSLSVWGVRSRWSNEFQRLLDALAPYDSGSGSVHQQVENYLLSIGVTAAELSRIREYLIEPGGPEAVPLP